MTLNLPTGLEDANSIVIMFVVVIPPGNSISDEPSFALAWSAAYARNCPDPDPEAITRTRPTIAVAVDGTTPVEVGSAVTVPPAATALSNVWIGSSNATNPPAAVEPEVKYPCTSITRFTAV
ncbi:MAG: hypothetical protein QM572_12730 [Nocardioides sp.]|uniref:hypothetical protein n=1 Tax=Nocardioides sp. TaxID=35761 RepID=UPI0039E492AD